MRGKKRMGHLKIHCDSCGSDWVVYHRDNWKDWKARTCPVCGKSIDPGTWDRQVLRAFGEMEDANLELVKDHTGSHGTLFTVSYIPDVVFPDRSGETDQLREEISDLKEGLEDLRSVVTRLLDSLFQV
jgi:hypothetical protein